MAITWHKDIILKERSTFRMGGKAPKLLSFTEDSDLLEIFSKIAGEWFILGGGSNIVFPDSDFARTIIEPAIKGIDIIKDEGDKVSIEIGAGVPWDETVIFAVENGLSGIEALSFIPGSTGATPIQNVGAYGVEIKDVLENVRAFDIEKNDFVDLSNAECRFGYRDSFFKNEGKGKYIITKITISLSSRAPKVPDYPGVKEYFESKGIESPSISDIREAIISIRTKKLPDPKEIASVGSFFKNSFVPKDQAEKLKETYPKLAVFPVNEEISKVGTGSLLETLGYRGKTVGNFSFYHGNAMVVVNEGNGTQAELLELIETVKADVKKNFGIKIKPEPEIIKAAPF